MKTIYCIIEGYGGTGYTIVYATTNEMAAIREWDHRRTELLQENATDFEREIDESLSLEERWEAYMDNTDTTELHFDTIEELQDEEDEDGDE